MLTDRLELLKGLDPEPPGLPGFRRAMPVLPLFHRLGEPLRAGELILEVATTKQGRAAVGTDRCVFASVGVAAYLTPPLVLAFGPMEEAACRRGRVSAPWDTREVSGLIGHPDPAALVAEWSVAAPDDETYLAEYLARCFGDLHQWLSGAWPTGQDVLNVIGALTRLAHDQQIRDVEFAEQRRLRMTTPEARYPCNVDLSDGLLLAAFVDIDHAVGTPAEPAWAQTCDRLEDLLGDDFHRMRRGEGPVDLRAAAYRFVVELLTVEGIR